MEIGPEIFFICRYIQYK